MRLLLWSFFALVLLAIQLPVLAQKANLANAKLSPNQSFFRALNLTSQSPRSRKPIKIAVIDAGFRVSHRSIQKYININNNEVPNNLIDDDHNGYTDDWMGWDVADEDNDVSIKKGMEDALYHGTYISSIIVSVVEQVFGSDAWKYVTIIPIKATPESNSANKLNEAYEGFAYARAVKADIICCAWTGGSIKESEVATIQSILQNGTSIIAAAGNFMTERIETPASISGVLAVAAVDSHFIKIPRSNYGMRIDVSAPGLDIYGAHPDADNAFIFESGTSAATAVVTGIVAALKVISPSSDNFEIRQSIVNTAKPVDYSNLSIAGKMGAGIPDFEKALDYLRHSKLRSKYFDPARPEGILLVNKKLRSQQWSIQPAGGYKGLHLNAMLPADPSLVTVYNKDSIVFEGTTSKLNRIAFLPGSSFQINYKPLGSRKYNQAFTYFVETIDSAKLYCQGKKTLIVDSVGFVNDGSGLNNYANLCECTWQLIAPAGKRIRIQVIEIDTEPLVDYIWFFDGSQTHEDALFAKLSGTELPPIIESAGNEVLIWFITDKAKSGRGWTLKYFVLDK